MKKISLLFLLLTLASNAQELQKGSVIKNYGKFYNIQNPDFKLNLHKKYKVIFDIRKTTNDVNVGNPLLDIVARFVNIHVAQGVPLENLDIVVVFHGSATKDILSQAAYKEKFRKKNPSLNLLKELNKIKIKIYVCGQSALHYNIQRNDVAKPVQFTLSALSVLTEYQSLGYQIIDFN
ncbi:MAG: DsrE family protein [Flavobacteriaceae bacterium]|nr:DsrE family protein [Flavobacteriaceae bacterium]